MSIVMDCFTKQLQKLNIEYYQDYEGASVVSDAGVGVDNPSSIAYPAWDVSGYEGDSKVKVNLRSRVSPRLAAKIIEMYESYA